MSGFRYLAFLPWDSGVIWHRDQWSLCGRVTVLDFGTLKSKLQPNLVCDQSRSCLAGCQSSG